jgi:putative peptide zinc metalloprotease protein
MNLTRVLDVALPDIPVRTISHRAPRMPPDAVWKEHFEDGKPMVRVLVASLEAMYRFPLPNWELARLFDGVRSYEEIAELYSRQTGAEYSPDEVREFAASLEAVDFWYKTPQEKNILLMQKDAQKRRKALKSHKSKYGDLAQITFPAVNPDRFLTWFHKYTYWVYTWWWTAITLAVFAFMTGITLTYWSEIGRDTLRFFNFSEKSWADVGTFYLVAVGAMCWHEIGHGHACKHYGGRVPSMGFLLIYLTPAFYTDTAEGQVMATRSQRFVIALAGAWAELYICAVATILWWASPPDTTLHSVAYMMMLITGIASLLINFNPLIKLDGYYMMSETFGLVDLKESSTAYVSAWVKRHIWHLPVEVPYVPKRWRFGYVIYALLSGLYSYTVLYVVARFVGNISRNFDPDWSFIPELATAAIVFRSRIRTLVNFMKFVYLDKRDRVRAWLVSRHPLVLFGVLAAVLFLPLWHESIRGNFILEPERRVVVRSLVAGTVRGVYADEGMRVAPGTLLFRLDNLPLQSKLGRSEADYQVASMRATSAALHYSDIGPSIQDRNRLAAQSRELGKQALALEVVSPMSGVVLTPHLGDRLWSFIPEGTELTEIGDLSVMRARIYVSEYDIDKLKVGLRARLMVNGSLRKWDTEVASIAPQSITIDPQLAEATKFKGLSPPNFYVVAMRLANPEGSLKPGMVGLARVYGPRRSAIGLWWDAARRTLVRKVW